MKISYGDKELLESKAFLALGLGETTITIGEGPETLNFILDFIEQKDEKQKVDFQKVDDKTLKLKFTNWNNPFGTTFTEPLEVGVFNSRKLFLMIYVQKAGATGEIRDVTFSAYLGRSIQSG